MDEVRSYASLSDVQAQGIATPDENAVEELLKIASAKLRVIAKNYGKDIDAMIDADPDFEIVVKAIVVQSVSRALSSLADNSPAITSGSQGALGYSVSMTYLNAGQSLYFLRNELKELGILRQRYGAVEVYADAADD